jgi:hypothetical protein
MDFTGLEIWSRNNVNNNRIFNARKPETETSLTMVALVE